MKTGRRFLSDLPLGSYKIVEVTAPEGFVLNGEAQTVTFTYKDQNTPVIEQEAVFRNERQKSGSIRGEKGCGNAGDCGRRSFWVVCQRGYSGTRAK